MIRILLLFFSIALASATTCSQLKGIYSDASCCSNGNADTCLRQIPLCSASGVSNGYVCVDSSGNIVVKGLLDAFAFPGDKITLKKSIIPDTNAAYDLGSAEYKIRHQYLSN